MNRRGVLLQLAIFSVIAVSVIAYALFDVLGVSVTSRPYDVTMQLSTGGGIFTGSEVTYRGVHVGTVSGIALHRSGVTLTLSLDKGLRIPASATAHVYDFSVVGEQYVDLVGTNGPGPFLHQGSVIPVTQTTTPPETATVLFDLEQWVNSINPKDVSTLSTQLAAAFAGSGPELRAIITSGGQLINELAASQSKTLDLLTNANTLLHTAANHSGDFDAFTKSLLALSTTLKSSTPAITALVNNSASTTELVDHIITQDGSAAAVLLANAATFSQIQVTNIPGLKALLIAVPEFGELAPQVLQGGALHGAALFNYDQPVCSTGIPLTSPISGIKTPLHAVGCPNPVPGELVRGATNAPTTEGGNSADASADQRIASSAHVITSGSTQVGGYNPANGVAVTANGTPVQLGWDGGQDTLLGTNSWQSLLLSPIGN